MADPTIVCVLGMHRSGTSCLAGSLEAHGLFLGETVVSAPYNKKGNKEHVPFRDLNDAVLAASGGAWDRPPESLVWTDALRRQRDALIDSFADHSIWGFKDPRTVLTLPFWLESEADIRLVGTFRHPNAVASSLMKRPGMEPATSPLALWSLYNTILLNQLKSQVFPLINFDWNEDRYQRAIEEITSRLGLQRAASPFYAAELNSQSGQAAAQDDSGPAAMAIYCELDRFTVRV